MDVGTDDRGLDSGGDFASTLQRLMARTVRRDADLARLTGIPARTIEKWRRGEVRHPRLVTDLLKLAHALALDADDTSSLLQVAGHPSLDMLHLQAQKANDHTLATLVAAWAVPAPNEQSNTIASSTEQPVQGLRHQLRAPITDFIGRVPAVAQLIAAVPPDDGVFIGGIHGMGGIGKTELAYYVAHKLTAIFSDAQVVVGLRGSGVAPRCSCWALQRVIRAFRPNAKLPDDLPTLQQYYCTTLQGQRVLILVDDACNAAQVQALIPPVGCGLLITSRQRFTLPGMTTVDLDALEKTEATLLLQGICARLTHAEALAIARACEYLPLALRISGGILRNDPALEVADYIQRLSDTRQRLAQLRDPDDPELDVAASLALSYDQLDARAQSVFRQLGVMEADFTLELALSVVVPPEGADVTQTLHLLLRRNLVGYDRRHARWRLHDLVRAMSLHQLEEAKALKETAWRYAQAGVQIMDKAQAQYMAGGDSIIQGLACFDIERIHIDSGRRWATTYAGTPEWDTLLVDYVVATKYIGDLRYDLQHDRLQQLEKACAAARRLGDLRREGYILNQLGIAYSLLGGTRQAIPYFQQALAAAQASGDCNGEGRALTNLGNAAANLGDSEQAITCLEQALLAAHASKDKRLVGGIMNNLGDAYMDFGNPKKALLYLEQAVTIAREIKDLRGESLALSTMGNVLCALGEVRQAITILRHALDIVRTINHRWSEAYALSYLGHAYATLGEHVPASAMFEQALLIFDEIGDLRGTAECQWRFGLFLAQQGEAERALSLLHACLAHEEENGYPQVIEHREILRHMEARVNITMQIGTFSPQTST